MKITNLTLEKYGAISQRQIDIGEAAGLTIIYGPNEAGKSTSLEAISDFLFGIPTRSDRGEIFGYPAMRLSASLALQDGQMLSLTRAKRNSKSLTDAAGQSADTAMAQILGAMTRDRYATLFGLNHESLRDGGERLLAADGEIGRLIVEAGGGLRHLVGQLDDLEKQADALYGARKKADRLFYQQLERFTQADKEAKAASLSRETYEQSRKAVETASSALEHYRRERRELATAAAKLQRISRVVPHLRAVDAYQAELADSEDLAEYPADFAQKISQLLAAKADSSIRAQAAKAHFDVLTSRLDALTVHSALSAAEADIRALDERATHVSKAREDRANRQKEMEDGEAKLAELRRLLSLAPDADLSLLSPDAAALKSLRGLAEERMARAPLLANSKERADELAEKISVLDSRLVAAQAAGYDQLPDVSSAHFSTLAGQKATLDQRAEALQAEEAQLAARLADLGFAEVAELRRFACPSTDDVRQEQQQRALLQAQLEEQAKQQRAAERALADAQRDVEQLQQAGEVASDQSVAEARAARAGAWQAIKSAYVAGPLPDDVASRLAAADQLDAALMKADELADRRASEAERSAHVAQAQRRAAEAKADILGAQTETSALHQAIMAREAAWARSFPDLSARFQEIAAALHFVQQREDALAMADRLQQSQQALALDTAQIAPLIAQLEGLERRHSLDGAASFAARVSAVQSRLIAHEKAQEAYARDAESHANVTAEWKRHQAAWSAHDQAEAEALAAWPQATAAAGLTADISPSAATQVANEWISARGVLDAIGLTKKRLARMAEDEKTLAQDVAALAARLELEIAGDCVATAKMLRERAAANTQVHAQKEALAPNVEQAKQELEAAMKALEQAQSSLAELAASLHQPAADEAALAQCAARFEARLAVLAAIKAEEQTASSAGDQQDLLSLRAEWGGRDLDAVRAELLTLEQRAASVERDIEQAILSEKEARDRLARFASDNDVNHAVAVREAAAAEMHLALERYLEISLARALVSQAMANLRAQQQDPLIAQAGRYFAAMTLGEFVGIEADVNEKGQPEVVGCRANKQKARVQHMSDGTRDQLFLAFRLASIAHYSNNMEPLPFIADDILVHFDDERSAATLALLAEFGKQQQILLFTHHQSVRDLAQPLAAQGLAQIVTLDRAGPAAA